MSTHTVHLDLHEHGLADGCPRCAEHAENPTRDLDFEYLTTLIRMALERRQGNLESRPRSETEAVAVARVLTAMEQAGKLARTAPGIMAVYLRQYWRVPYEVRPSDPLAGYARGESGAVVIPGEEAS